MLAGLPPKNIASGSLLATDDAGRQLHYRDLHALRDTWAQKVPGRRLVALYCKNDVPTLGAYIGLHAAGHVIIMLSSKLAEVARADLVQRYGVEATVEDGVVTLIGDAQGGLHPDLAICLSTSGSTGSPKLVQFSTEQLAENARAIATYLALTPNDAPLAHLPMEYSFGLSVLHSHMAVGAHLLLTDHSVMQKPFWARLGEATSLSGVPFHFEMLLRMRLAKAELPRMRMLTQAGGRLGAKEAQALYDIAKKKGWQFHIMYGQTEAGPRIAWLPFDRMDGHLDCIGQPIPGVQLDLGADGELIVRSPSVMLGYAQSRGDLANGDQMGGVLQTGDLAEVVDGLYRITGRKSRFIKLQGNRVGLADVEAKLADAGHTVACVGRDDLLTIFALHDAPDTVRQSAIDLFSFPPRSMKVLPLADFPRRSNDKVDYAALQALSEEAP